MFTQQIQKEGKGISAGPVFDQNGCRRAAVGASQKSEDPQFSRGTLTLGGVAEGRGSGTEFTTDPLPDLPGACE